MFSWFGELFNTNAFEPHGSHFSQYPDLLWFTIISNILIAVAYYSIPITLGYFVYKRRDIPFNWMFFMFSAFIFFCGTHHVVHVLSFWYGLYALEGLIDALTGAISIVTAIMLWYILPLALKIPNVKAFEQQNFLLKEEVRRRQIAEKEVRKFNKLLEKRVEEKTKEVIEGAEKFQTLADNIPILTWMANSDGSVFWYNSRWYEYTGKTLKDMEGWGWQSVHEPQRLKAVVAKWKTSLRTKEPFEMVFPLKGADGVFRPFLTRVRPVKDAKGNVIRWFGTNTDISEQMKDQERKDVFMSMASHELRTPVTSIKAFVQTLRSHIERGSAIDLLPYLSKIDKQLDKLKNLIYDLLDMSRTAHGQLYLRKEYFSIRELLEDVVIEIQGDAKRHVIHIHGNNDLLVQADRDRIHQVVVNLLTNAIKYSPPKNKIILNIKKEKKKCLVCVEDFGIGIAEEYQKRVFDRFFRVFGEQDKNIPGLGIGLYIAAEIIQKHGEQIWVKSTLGKGSLFCFSLPIANDKMMDQNG